MSKLNYPMFKELNTLRAPAPATKVIRASGTMGTTDPGASGTTAVYEQRYEQSKRDFMKNHTPPKKPEEMPAPLPDQQEGMGRGYQLFKTPFAPFHNHNQPTKDYIYNDSDIF